MVISKGWLSGDLGGIPLGEGLTAPHYKNQHVVKCHTVPGGLDRGISGWLVLTR